MQRTLAPENFGAIGDGKTDDSAALAKLFETWKQLKPLQSAKLEFTAGKTYTFSRPLVMEGPSSNFYPLVDFNGAKLVYTGGKGKGAAMRIGYSEPKKERHRDGQQKPDETAECRTWRGEFRNLYLTCTSDGADELLRLDVGIFCALRSCNVQGAGNRSVAVGVMADNQQNLVLDQFSVSFADVGFQCGSVCNVLGWRNGKVDHCGVGLALDGSTFTVDCVDFSNCDRAVVMDHASKGTLHIYSEDCGLRGMDDEGCIVEVKNSRNVVISGLLNCKGRGWVDGTGHCAWGAIVTDSSVRFDNVECLMPRRGLYFETNSKVFTDQLTNVRTEPLPARGTK